ncbi:MAG: GNAT family N-acetyltransferase [Candidatus Dormibacteraeota bacterium]|nr:GNAT family N-acetyltransferase [Candidatus Dormibacteraeota bacterium]
MTTCSWRGKFDNVELNRLHAEAFDHQNEEADWWGRVNRHSLGWACARDGDQLVGFINVAWDGGAHAFILDTLVAARLRRRGIGTELVALAVDKARAAGCDWLHVDFEAHLGSFYLDRCGFTSTNAGLIRL